MLTGTRIGVYQIQSLLGAGAMGEVYRARDPKLLRDVAIKVSLKLFTTDDPDRSYAGTDYVPSRDGQRFGVTVPAAPTSPPALVITINWPELLGRQ